MIARQFGLGFPAILKAVKDWRTLFALMVLVVGYVATLVALRLPPTQLALVSLAVIVLFLLIVIIVFFDRRGQRRHALELIKEKKNPTRIL